MTSPYKTGTVGTFASSSSSKIEALAWWGYKWGGSGEGTSATITYSFPTHGSLWSSTYRNDLQNEPFNGFRPFDADQQSAAKRALATWAEVANITFKQVSDTAGDGDVGDIRFGNSGSVGQDGSAAWAYRPYDDNFFTYAESGDVWVDNTYGPNLQLGRGQFGYSTLVHEIGHALGLSHPFSGANDPGKPTLPASQDNQRYTIMAYDTYSGATIEAYGPMLYDILAIQYIYGANMTTRAGNNVYSFRPDTEYLECIWDAGGQDTIDLSRQTRNQVINLNAGTFSSIGIRNDGKTAVGNVAIAFNVTIEDAIGGGGHDKIMGNGASNSLCGEDGNDTIAGGGGRDTLNGGAGADSMSGGVNDDLYYVNHSSDRVSETGGQGLDQILSSASYRLAAGCSVEILDLMGTANLNATGNSYVNTLIGNAGRNILDGGAGADVLDGGSGNDTYIIDNAGDQVEEQSSDSGDLVKTSVRISAGISGIENYTYTGTRDWTFTANELNNTVTGGSGSDTLTGGDGLDALLGNGGNDLLIGQNDGDWLNGGTGSDIMQGGAGNDSYVVDTASDIVDEESNTDTDDVIRSSISVNLVTQGAGAIEHARLLGTAAINASGNDQDNILVGNTAANRLDGGLGADEMYGGLGSDTYAVDDLGDLVVETSAAGGTDRVWSSISYTLTDYVEYLNLSELGGDIDGTGNTLNNRLTGNSGDNRLDGGAGSDTMIGGAGNDTYVVSSTKDVVQEDGDGVDTVESSVSFSLSLHAQVENLTLTGAAAINGTGNALDNAITGNGSANTLIGGWGDDTLVGGVGQDRLSGGNDSDVFDFNAVSELGDTITDFTKGLDQIDISDLLDSVGYVSVDDIFQDGYVGFTYDGTTTNLWFDQTGSGDTTTTKLASLLNVNLTNADIGSFIV